MGLMANKFLVWAYWKTLSLGQDIVPYGPDEPTERLWPWDIVPYGPVEPTKRLVASNGLNG